jgi:ubiquinone/menaquinone biosynthesis C-methylase UbiE
LGLDISSTMVRLASERTAPFGERARVELSDGETRIPVPDGSLDRVVSNYVLDLLSPDDIERFVGEARRALSGEGRLCLVSLTRGTALLSRFLTSVWLGIHALRPSLVGGCRPIRCLDSLAEADWRIQHHEVITSFGLPSEVLVAAPRKRQ